MFRFVSQQLPQELPFNWRNINNNLNLSIITRRHLRPHLQLLVATYLNSTPAASELSTQHEFLTMCVALFSQSLFECKVP